MNRTFLVMGAVFAFLAVGIGAFGAHALESYFNANPSREATYQTAVQYQMFHVVGLLVVAWMDGRQPTRLTRTAGWLFVAGTLLFSGSLYLLATLQIGVFGAVAPLGGLSFLSGWALVGVAGARGG